MPIITNIEPQKHDAERVNVYVDGAFALGISAMLAVARGLRPGAEIGEEELEALAVDDEVERAYAAALNFLSFRPRSAREIRDYFKRKQTASEVAEAVVERLQRAGLIDDHEFARYWIENRQTFRPRGSRALRVEMRQKGLASDVIEEALEGLEDEEITAYRVGMKKARSYAREDRREFFRKMATFLQRRGFSYQVAASASKRIWSEVGGSDDGLDEP